MTHSKTAAIYCRISRDAEGEGTGVNRQETLCRELADRLGLTVAEVFVDNDIGASDRTSKSKVRHDFNRMMEATRAGQFTHILAYSNSRLTRRLRELEDLIQLHEETGVVIQTVVSGQDDLSTSDGRMVARIKASVDAAESDRISERQKAAFRHNALSGKPKLHRQRPFGWKADGVTIEPKEASLVRDALKKILAGATIAEIRREWEKAGVKTAAGSSEWDWATVRNVILGWRAAGVRTYHREPLYGPDGKLVMGQWEPLISLEDREAGLAMIAKHARIKRRSGTWKLTGLLRCGQCSSPLYGQLASGSRPMDTYACKRSHVSINAERLEWYVFSQLYFRLLNRLESEVEESAAISVAPSEPEPWEGEERLSEITTRIEELMEAFTSGKLSGEIVFPQVDKLDLERRKLRREQDELHITRAEPEFKFQTSEEIWDYFGKSIFELSEDEKILILRQELETVIINKGERGWGARTREAFEKRFTIVWKER